MPLILQQAQIRDILARQAQQGQQGGQEQGTGGQPGAGEIRRLGRPRMRGFTLGGFRFRFGIVFHSVQQVPQQQPTAAGVAVVNGATAEQYEQQLPPAPAEENVTAGNDSPTEAAPGDGDNLELRRYVAELSASAEAVDQLEREGNLDLEPSLSAAAAELVNDNNDNEEHTEEDVPINPVATRIVVDEIAEIRNFEAEEEANSMCKDAGETEVISSPLREGSDSAEDCSTSEAVVDNTNAPRQTVDESVDLPEEVEERSLSTSDIQDIRENLLSVSEEAQQLLNDLNSDQQ